MDFVHCNVCFVQPGPPANKKFTLSSCGHLFCDFCENSSSSECKACKSTCRFVLLTDEMPENLRIYFSDLSKEIKRLLTYFNIQLQQAKIYIEDYVPLLESKVHKLKSFFEHQKNIVENLKRENSKLKDEIFNLKRELENMRQYPGVSPLFSDVSSPGSEIIYRNEELSRGSDFFKRPQPAVEAMLQGKKHSGSRNYNLETPKHPSRMSHDNINSPGMYMVPQGWQSVGHTKSPFHRSNSLNINTYPRLAQPQPRRFF